mmetsp:Transcript_6363/g.20322  ORF Transcript_6363/g.20322 Transcript_6363/m.20322 type:complete len:380 (-) Transcript_6363:127-1266(-)
MCAPDGHSGANRPTAVQAASATRQARGANSAASRRALAAAGGRLTRLGRVPDELQLSHQGRVSLQRRSSLASRPHTCRPLRLRLARRRERRRLGQLLRRRRNLRVSRRGRHGLRRLLVPEPEDASLHGRPEVLSGLCLQVRLLEQRLHQLARLAAHLLVVEHGHARRLQHLGHRLAHLWPLEPPDRELARSLEEGLGCEGCDEGGDDDVARVVAAEHPQGQLQRLLEHRLVLERRHEQREERGARGRVLCEGGDKADRPLLRHLVLQQRAQRLQRQGGRLHLHLLVAERARRGLRQLLDHDLSGALPVGKRDAAKDDERAAQRRGHRARPLVERLLEEPLHLLALLLRDGRADRVAQHVKPLGDDVAYMIRRRGGGARA